MEKRHPHTNFLNDTWGTNRAAQLLPALLPEFAPIDDREPIDFLVFAQRFAKFLQYYNTKNKPAGDWTPFFDKDISIFLATIAFKDDMQLIQNRDRLLLKIGNARESEQQEKALHDFVAAAWEMVKDLDSWYKKLERFYAFVDGQDAGILYELESLIQGRLNEDRVKLDGFTKYIRSKISEAAAPFPLKATSLHDIWKTGFLPTPIPDKEGQTNKEKIEQVLKYVQLSFQSLLNAYLQIIDSASRYLRQSLTANASHSPDVGLFLAFVHLFQYLQEDINGLTEDHLNLYYKKILRQQPYPAISDEVNIQVVLADDLAEGVFLEAGTLLNAGVRNDIPTFYEVTEGSYLNNARIEQLRTVFIAKNKKLGTGTTYGLVSGIYSTAVANSRDGLGSPLAPHESWPTFGEDQLLKAESEKRMIPAQVGLAVSDPILLLGEGDREITVRLQFSEVSAATLEMLVLDIARMQGLSREEAFSQYFQDGLRLFLSTEEGWYESKYYNLKPVLGPYVHELVLTLSLIRSDPAVVSWHDGLEGESFDTPWPVLKVLLNPEANPFVYSFLSELVLDDIYLHVKVKKMRQLDVFNEFGKLDNSQPFQPFGQLPAKGSYFLLGNPELFHKKLSRLDIELTWHNLPLKKGGLTEHYAPYELGITNESFLANLSVLTENEFSPPKIKDRPVYPLFSPKKSQPDSEGERDTGDDRLLALGIERPLKTPPPPLPPDAEENQLTSRTRIEDINLKELGFYPDYGLESTDNFDLSSQSGFFKLELIAPDEAFGHQAFPRIFTDVVTENAVNRGLRQLNPFKRFRNRTVPDPPYTPTLQSLSIDYEAESRINMQRVEVATVVNGGAQVFHLHPFGIRSAYHPQKITSRAIVPSFSYDGYLFIGIQDLAPPQVLTLYFQMEKNAHYQASEEPPEIDWHYLSDGEWTAFRKESFIADATFGFTTSGIIKIEIPVDLKPDDLLPAEGEPLSWIRIAVKGNISILSRTNFLCAQAIKARWVRNENAQHLKTSLPAGSINSLEKSVPEVVELIQPYASFGGKAEERRDYFYVRVSERLRHKNRAITNWDIEHLVLSKFPQIQQVKSVSLEKGRVTVIVIPKLDSWKDEAEPKVSFGMLQEVKSYLEEIASPFISIQVRNAQFDYVKARFTVVFKEKRDASGLIRQLEEDLNKFICPWRFDPAISLELGGNISKDATLKYLSSLDYVQMITGFSLVHIVENEDEMKLDKGEFSLYDPVWKSSTNPVISASTPWSVIVPSSTHLITFSFKQEQFKADPAGIGNLSVETDFIIPSESDLEGEEMDYQFISPETHLLSLHGEDDDQYFLTIELD